jgi:hypothetical protein
LYGCETWSLTLSEEQGAEENVWSEGGEVTGDWRKLHNEELHNLYSSPSIIRMMKSRKTRWAKHVAGIGRKGVHTRFQWESQKGEGHWEGIDIDGK